MARSTGQSLRLSTSELEDAMREEKKKWRIFRLQQVREQARIEAGRVRGAVRNKKKEMVRTIGKEILQNWQEDKENQVQQLRQEYDECFRAFGKAHDQAKEEPDAVEMLAENIAINRQKAARRGCEASKAQREHKAEKERDNTRLHQRKKSAIRKEKLRANRIAQLPTPKAFKTERVIVPEPAPTVQLYEHGTLTTTNYVPKDVVIEKEIKSTKPSAHQLAEVEERVIKTAKEIKRNEAEDIERKREKRGRAALHKERLHRMYRDMMEQLDRAQHDHRLSGFIRGVDLSIYETEAARLRSLAAHQHDMEAAVERILRDRISGETEEESLIPVPEEPSDLKEISEDSELEALSETAATKGKGLPELQEEIRKHRILVNQVINDLHESSRERERDDVDVEDTGEPGIDTDGETTLNPELSNVSEVMSRTDSRIDRELSASPVEPRDEVPYREEVEVDRRVQIISPRETRARGQNDDIHLAETVPVHLMPEHRGYRRIPVIETDIESSQSTSERTLQPGSSDDIEVRIHFSGDSSTIQSSAPPDKPRIPDRMRPSRRYQGDHLVYPGDGSSTEYLSLPSSFSFPVEKDHLHNLEKIQQRRHDIQRLLDGKGHHAKHQEMMSPITYMQEMCPEGSERKPLSRKGKFELKKQELIHHYIKKLLSCRDDELMQISASTVEGSGMTVSSLCTLLETLNRDKEDSVFSSLANLTESPSSEIVSSAYYPDIDQIPTKLSSSPELIVNPGLFPNVPRFYPPRYGPDIFPHFKKDIDSSSSTIADSRYSLVHTPVDIHEPESSYLCPRETSFPSHRTCEFPSALPHPPTPAEESSTSATTLSDSKFDEVNLQRELKILQDLKILQKLKQELLKKKDTLLKEEDEVDERLAHHGEGTNAATTTLLPGNESQTAIQRSTNRTSDQIYRHVLPHSKENVERDGTSISYRTGQSRPWDRNAAISRVPVWEARNKSNEEGYSEDSEDNFMVLRPEGSHASTLASSGIIFNKDGFKKPSGDLSFSRTRFKQLVPETTLQSERIASNVQPSSFQTDITASSSKQDADDSFPRQVALTEYDERVRETSMPTREVESSSDMPRDSTKDQTSMSNQSGENAGRSSSSNSKAEKSSGESVTSIPDMAEILQRFGLDWAKSMIRKMDKAEEHSSSGN